MIRPTRTTGGVAALALALTVVALLIASPAAALAAGSLALFLLWRGWRFERDLAAVAASLKVNREVDRTILRQGATTTVRVTTTLTPPPGMEVRVRDVPPAVAAGDAPLCRPGETATYTIRLMAPGETTFGGVLLEANDAFFSRDLLVSRLNAPPLRVFPAGTTATGGGRGTGVGETEVDRKATLDGQSIRGFRPYRSGDDPGRIDWKISARHNVLYVREQTGLEGGAPLIVIDLPARDADPETFARFSMAVSGAVEGAIRSRDGCSLLVVTSGEILRFLPETRDLREALQALSGLAPVEPRNPLYRAPGPTVLAARARLPGGSGGQEKTCLARLGGVLTAFARESRSPFSAAIAAALARVEATEVHLYTLITEGDRSHLTQVIHQAKARGMRVVASAPDRAPILPGVDAVEVI
jgi:uncharacterized protein (DUF58 family)